MLFMHYVIFEEDAWKLHIIIIMDEKSFKMKMTAAKMAHIRRTRNVDVCFVSDPLKFDVP